MVLNSFENIHELIALLRAAENRKSLILRTSLNRIPELISAQVGCHEIEFYRALYQDLMTQFELYPDIQVQCWNNLFYLFSQVALNP